jgi:hypothetical protein
MSSFPEIEYKSMPAQPIVETVEDAHAFLRAVYQNPDVPLAVRMKAAAIAIEYERPTLRAVAVLPPGGDFAKRLELAIERSSRPPMKVIEARLRRRV